MKWETLRTYWNGEVIPTPSSYAGDCKRMKCYIKVAKSLDHTDKGRKELKRGGEN